MNYYPSLDVPIGSMEHRTRFMESLGRSLSKSISNSLNKSFTNPGFLEAYYNFQYSTQQQGNSAVGTPSRDLAYFAGMEDQFCKDFSCCGIKLRDLHELLQHFEENHVILESDMEEDDDLPFIIDNVQDVEMGDYSDNKKSRNAQTGSVALSDIYQSDNHHLSAFDTSIIRKRMQPSPPQPWRQTVESPPNTFPITLEGPTKYIRNQDAMETEPVNESPAPPEVQDEEMEEVADRDDRPYKCKIVGCNKSYKNPGGLKYHMHHGHCEDTGDPEMNNIIHKPYQCTVADCAKRYKNLNGLKYHIEHAHSNLLGV